MDPDFIHSSERVKHETSSDRRLAWVRMAVESLSCRSHVSVACSRLIKQCMMDRLNTMLVETPQMRIASPSMIFRMFGQEGLNIRTRSHRNPQ
jgi:hypothetical protein